jgi:hypothetical protein
LAKKTKTGYDKEIVEHKKLHPIQFKRVLHQKPLATLGSPGSDWTPCKWYITDIQSKQNSGQETKISRDMDFEEREKLRPVRLE